MFTAVLLLWKTHVVERYEINGLHVFCDSTDPLFLWAVFQEGGESVWSVELTA